MIWIPNKEDQAIILSHARKWCALEAKDIQLAPALRRNIRGTRASMNIALVSQDPMFQDTEVVDYATWKEFLMGVPLPRNAPPRAIIDFILRDRRTWLSLANPVVYYEAGHIQQIVMLEPHMSAIH